MKQYKAFPRFKGFGITRLYTSMDICCSVYIIKYFGIFDRKISCILAVLSFMFFFSFWFKVESKESIETCVE